jgi:hypothetical protein
LKQSSPAKRDRDPDRSDSNDPAEPVEDRIFSDRELAKGYDGEKID